MRVGECALRHGERHRLADGAVLGQHGLGHAQQLRLRRVGISDEAALDHVGGAGNLGEQPGDQSAGAALRGGELQAAVAQVVEEGGCRRRQLGREQHWPPLVHAVCPDNDAIAGYAISLTA
jgi:hypothetical protein